MRIYAHRGVSAHYPENTLAAFARAIELGVDGIELDVHLSGDRVPVVIHDDTVERTTNGIGALADFTARQLGLLDAGHRQHVPTLDAVLALAAGKARVNIELKDAAAVGPVLDVVAAHPGLDWFASSGDWQALTEMAALSPVSDCHPTTLGLSMDPAGPGGLRDALAFAHTHGGTGISIWEGSLDRTAVESIHDSGLHVWAWTVNDPARARELADLGVDALCTDDPELVRNALTASALGR
ncbi:MAG: glycerophosphodiester phosphodiesterase family protein [Specibacter sp.]